MMNYYGQYFIIRMQYESALIEVIKRFDLIIDTEEPEFDSQSGKKFS